MEQNTPHNDQMQLARLLQAARARIVTMACAGLGLAVVAIIGGWAVTGTLEDWETVVGGLLFGVLLAGLAVLAKRGQPSLSAALLSGMLFLLVIADTAYYGLGSPSAAALLLPVLLIACTFGRKLGLAAAAFASVAVFGIAWASMNGMLTTEIPAAEAHLSFNAPLLSVILLFSAGLAGSAVEVYQQGVQFALQPKT